MREMGLWKTRDIVSSDPASYAHSFIPATLALVWSK